MGIIWILLLLRKILFFAQVCKVIQVDGHGYRNRCRLDRS